MGTKTVRTGAPVTPSNDGGNNPRVFTFTRDVRPCVFTCPEALGGYLKVNESDASASDFHKQFTSTSVLDLSEGGILAVKTVSVKLTGLSPDYDTIHLHGWEP